jgi:hypothetical protein
MFKPFALLAAGAIILGTILPARSANVIVYDSVISLATNVTKDYQFTDPSSGQSVSIAVTMTPYSESNASPVFTLLDTDSSGNYTHLGIDSGLGSGDGNWVDYYEGVNFTAALVSSSGGVTAGSIQFGISAMGMRPSGGSVIWISPACTNTFSLSDEQLYDLDTNLTTLTGYSGGLRGVGEDSQYQISDADSFDGQSIEFTAAFGATGVLADPRTNCWLTTYAGKYARIYTNNAMLAAGNTLTNWSNGMETQSLPAYCGIQEVYSSTNWVYVRSTGLASYIMGPWQNGAFPNLPVNQKVFYRFPRTNSVPATKTANGSGQIGIFVDGVAMYNSWDAFTWDIASNADEQNVTGYWNRDAYVNEGATFDPGYAHQQQSGVYHYHADPIGLRYMLGDHVDYNATTKTYSEDTNTPTKHSPILAWTADGYPLYGPYGYSNATNANSGIRRMVSGYVLRNGQYGTTDLPVTGRTTIPEWAVRLDDNVSSNQAGPPFNSIHTNGCYMEDNDYLGDHGYTQGVDFDLDQYNGRFCVTPEFPGGTYAYFVAISSNGTPVYPYNIGGGYYGNPVGGNVLAITEPVATNFLGNTNLTTSLGLPAVQTGTVTLAWSAIEGGSYEVESTTNLVDNWSTISTGNKSAPNQVTAGYTNITSLPDNFYRVGRTSVATYDTAGTTYFATNAVSPGGNANPGQTILLTITLPNSPPSPPAGASITSVTLGSLTAAASLYPAQGTVQAVFVIPSNYTPTGSQNVVVKFPSPAPTFTLSGGFTIN